MLPSAGCDQYIGGRNSYTMCPRIPCKFNGTLPDLFGNWKIGNDPFKLFEHLFFLLPTGPIPEFQSD